MKQLIRASEEFGRTNDKYWLFVCLFVQLVGWMTGDDGWAGGVGTMSTG